MSDKKLSLSYAEIARRRSSGSDVTSPHVMLSPVYSHTAHHCPKRDRDRDRGHVGCKCSNDANTTEDGEHHEPNSTPKRRRISRELETMPSAPQLARSLSLITSTDQRSYKHSLITGYIRQCIGMRQFPEPIASLIQSFYDEIIYWNLKGEDMQRFQSMKNGQAMYGPTFELCKGITFDLTLCPNGWKSTQEGSVQFYIELKHLPSYIANITVYYELYCKETKSQCKKIRVFRKATDAQSWGTNNMLKRDCEHFDRLEFGALVQVLHVEYTKQARSKICDLYIKPKTLRERTCFDYNLDKALLDEFVECHEGKFYYSPSFGHKSFCLEMSPNGWHLSNRGKFMVYVRLLALPQRIKSIRCECMFDSDQHALISPWKEQQTFSYEIHGVQWPLDLDTVTLKSLDEISNLRLTVKIQITEVIDAEGNKIQRDRWPQYGIILCNSNSNK